MIEDKEALINATYEPNDDDIRELLRKGADLDIQEDGDGKTALMYAITEGFYRLARLYIKLGADVNLTTKIGDSALDMAITKKKRFSTFHSDEKKKQLDFIINKLKRMDAEEKGGSTELEELHYNLSNSYYPSTSGCILFNLAMTAYKDK